MMGEESGIVSSQYPILDISQHTFHDFMLEFIRAKPERIALVDGVTGRSVTFFELDESIRRVASGLHRLGVRRGDVIIIFSLNRIEFIIALFGIIANGAAACLVNPTYTTYELEHAIKVAKPAWILAASDLLPRLRDAIRNIPSSAPKGTIIFPEIHAKASRMTTMATAGAPGGAMIPFDVLMSDDGSWYPEGLDIDVTRDAALVMFSSGTTGLPKGVMLSHSNLVSMLSLIGCALADDTIHAPDEQPVGILFLPLFHSYGVTAVTMIALATNAKLVILPKYNTEHLLSCIEKYKVTLVPLVPPNLVYLAKYKNLSKYDLSSVRRYSAGAAPLSADTEMEFRNAVGSGEIRQGYGMTETTVACVINPPHHPLKPNSVGILLPNTMAKIIDPETMKVLGPKLRGELCIKGPQVMMGYLNNPEATKATIDEDGWLHTGDIGYYDEDDYFFIVDRLKELIKYKGFQVAPAELESLLLTHPEVADVAVIGITDKEAGELPKAFVVRKQPSNISAEQIQQFVAGKVSSYKHLRGGVEFMEQIPKSETGKILRRVLREGLPKSKL